MIVARSPNAPSATRGSNVPSPGQVVRTLLMLVVVALTLGPVVYTLLTSLKYLRDVITGSLLFTPTLENYATLFNPTESNFVRLALNSLVVGLASTLLVVSVGALAAYSLARFRWSPAVKGLVLGWLLFLNMLPAVVFVGAYYLIARSVGVYDTVVAVTAAHVVLNLPLTVFIMQSFFADVPRELEEAAAIDGCSRLMTFWRVVLPITRPGLAAAALLSFVFSWKDFLLALTLTSTPRGNTIPVGIAGFAQEYSIRYGEMAAAAFVAVIPALLIVVFAQRHIVKGLTMGAVKG